MKHWIPGQALSLPALLAGWLCLGTLALTPEYANGALLRKSSTDVCDLRTTAEIPLPQELVPAGYYHQSDFSGACSLWNQLRLGGQLRPPPSSFVPAVVHELWLDVNRHVANAKLFQEQMFDSIRHLVGIDRG